MARGYVQQGVYGLATPPNVLAPAGYGTLYTQSNVIPILGSHPDAIPKSPSPLDDEFPGPYLHQKWTQLNYSTTTTNIVNSRCVIHPPISGVDNFRILYQPMGTTTWTITAEVVANLQVNTFLQCGLVVRNSGSGRLLKLGITCTANVAPMSIQFSRLNSPTSNNADVSSFQAAIPNRAYLRMTCDGTNVQIFWSLDGTAFYPGTIEALSNFISSVDGVGIFVNNTNGSFSCYGSFDWFRTVPYKIFPF